MPRLAPVQLPGRGPEKLVEGPKVCRIQVGLWKNVEISEDCSRFQVPFRFLCSISRGDQGSGVAASASGSGEAQWLSALRLHVGFRQVSGVQVEFRKAVQQGQAVPW